MGPDRPYAPPTIWSLRAGIRRDGLQDNEKATLSPKETETLGGAAFYEHLFGYDPIRLLQQTMANPNRRSTDIPASPNSAENPRLNVIAPETNFIVRDLVSEDGDDA